MEEITYKFCGYDYGTFTAQDTGEVRKYCNIFCISHMEPRSGAYCGGWKAEKFKCSSENVFKGIEPMSDVNVWFDKYGRVSRIVPVESKK